MIDAIGSFFSYLALIFFGVLGYFIIIILCHFNPEIKERLLIYGAAGLLIYLGFLLLMYIHSFGAIGWIAVAATLLLAGSVTAFFLRRAANMRSAAEYRKNLDRIISAKQAEGDDDGLIYWQTIKNKKIFSDEFLSILQQEKEIDEKQMEVLRNNIHHAEFMIGYEKDNNLELISEELNTPEMQSLLRKVNRALEDYDRPKIEKQNSLAEENRLQREHLEMKIRLSKSSIDLAGLADVISKDDPGTKAGIKKINSDLHELMDYRALVHSDDDMQATLRFLQRRLREEGIQHEPIQLKLTRLIAENVTES